MTDSTEPQLAGLSRNQATFAAALLGLNSVAGLTPEKVKAAHRNRALERHPDAGGDGLAFGQLNLAKDALLSALQGDGASAAKHWRQLALQLGLHNVDSSPGSSRSRDDAPPEEDDPPWTANFHRDPGGAAWIPNTPSTEYRGVAWDLWAIWDRFADAYPTMGEKLAIVAILAMSIWAAFEAAGLQAHHFIHRVPPVGTAVVAAAIALGVFALSWWAWGSAIVDLAQQSSPPRHPWNFLLALAFVLLACGAVAWGIHTPLLGVQCGAAAFITFWLAWAAPLSAPKSGGPLAPRVVRAGGVVCAFLLTWGATLYPLLVWLTPFVASVRHPKVSRLVLSLFALPAITWAYTMPAVGWAVGGWAVIFGVLALLALIPPLRRLRSVLSWVASPPFRGLHSLFGGRSTR